MLPKAYVVFVGREPDVYERWSEASKQVSGFRESCYKGYETKEDAEEAFRSFEQAPDATRVEEKCECEKTSTSSTSRPHRPKNSQKLVKVLRDLAIEIHNHAARMEKVVEEIGQILEDMQLNDEEKPEPNHASTPTGNCRMISLGVRLLHGAALVKKEATVCNGDAVLLITKSGVLNEGFFNRLPFMAVASRSCSEETVTSKYVVPLIDLSSDEEEGLYAEVRSCGTKASWKILVYSHPCPQKSPKTRGPTAPIIINISDDSSA
ncbi:hypothetical protein F511_12401 [Dorcoceras hygrometricum]|uniref:Ribonuclease H1 N-terminal domain-containing protein n=1 Tax=Dorcoceras hygrometricum TaxID=472368 RepID=A0A2Z7C0E6_9LAMI|nr:hypothetical protein F511_12401 [Dorcoceras hygrometricum]